MHGFEYHSIQLYLKIYFEKQIDKLVAVYETHMHGSSISVSVYLFLSLSLLFKVENNLIIFLVDSIVILNKRYLY